MDIIIALDPHHSTINYAKNKTNNRKKNMMVMNILAINQRLEEIEDI
jgi:hypothetical protein